MSAATFNGLTVVLMLTAVGLALFAQYAFRRHDAEVEREAEESVRSPVPTPDTLLDAMFRGDAAFPPRPATNGEVRVYDQERQQEQARPRRHG